MFSYNKFFAGTVYYMLKIENRGVLSERPYLAISAVMIIALCESLLLWGVSFMWLDGVLMTAKSQVIGLVVTLTLLNAVIFLPKDRDIKIERRYKGESVV